MAAIAPLVVAASAAVEAAARAQEEVAESAAQYEGEGTPKRKR
jgi:hypothetical protein